MIKTGKTVYYGWHIAAVAFLGYFLSVGTGFYAFNAFLEPLCDVRGWTRTDLNLALVIGTMVGFPCQYVYGTILKKTGIRVLMLAGSIVAGISFIFIARVRILWELYLLYALLFIGNSACGGIVAASAVNNWFVDKRGKAIGIATAGMSMSGAVLPVIALLLIRHTGIKNAALFIGLAMISFGPLAWRVVRDWPEDMGMAPDGRTAIAGSPAAGQIRPGPPPATKAQWPLLKLVRTDIFWKLGLAFGMMMIGTVGVMSQLQPRFTNTGFAPMTAMMMMAATALAGAAGKYGWGTMCDRFCPGRVAVAMSLLNAFGLSFALVKGSISALLVFMAVFGFSMGGIMSAFPILVAAIFGRKNFTAVLRYISIFLVLQVSGYVIAGQSFDLTGSYDPAYRIFICLDLIAALLLISLKKQKPAGN